MSLDQFWRAPPDEKEASTSKAHVNRIVGVIRANRALPCPSSGVAVEPSRGDQCLDHLGFVAAVVDR